MCSCKHENLLSKASLERSSNSWGDKYRVRFSLSCGDCKSEFSFTSLPHALAAGREEAGSLLQGRVALIPVEVCSLPEESLKKRLYPGERNQ